MSKELDLQTELNIPARPTLVENPNFKPTQSGKSVGRKMGTSFFIENADKGVLFSVTVATIEERVVQADITKHQSSSGIYSETARIPFKHFEFYRIEGTDVVIHGAPPSKISGNSIQRLMEHKNGLKERENKHSQPKAWFVVYAPWEWKVKKVHASQITK